MELAGSALQQLLAHVQAVFKSSGYLLSFEPKKFGLSKSIFEKIAYEVGYTNTKLDIIV